MNLSSAERTVPTTNHASQAGRQAEREREVGPLSTAAPTAAVLPSSFAELDIEAIGGRAVRPGEVRRVRHGLALMLCN